MFGERLQEIRKDHGDTQQSLADKLHVTLFAVRCWEQGKSSPNYDTLIKICKLYHISSDYLLGLIDEDQHYLQPQQKRLSAENLMTVKKFTAFLLNEQNKKTTNS